jgi:hypothetical protein
MEGRNTIVNSPYIDSFTIQTLARILMFEQYLKYNLGFKKPRSLYIKTNLFS